LNTVDLTARAGVDPVVFPEGVNIEFAVAGPPPAGVDLYERMRVIERGSGETLSCGSGACAVAAVALARAGRSAGTVAVDVPGGRLTVAIDDACCWLAGPAVIVARGTLDPALVGGLSSDRVALAARSTG